MEAAGLQTRGDALGNLAGRRGAGRALYRLAPGLGADAGRYDGILGVLVGARGGRGRPTSRSSSSRSPTRRACASSRPSSAAAAFVGPLEPDELDAAATPTASMAGATALGGDAGPSRFRRAPARYFEVHIEQGPVLEAEGLAARRRHRDRRSDALQRSPSRATPATRARRRWTCAATRSAPPPSSCSPPSACARDEPGLVATVGELGVPHGACNVIPGRVEADARHPPPATTPCASARSPRCATQADGDLRARAASSSTLVGDRTSTRATPCTPRSSPRSPRRSPRPAPGPRTAERRRPRRRRRMAAVTDVAMLFVRSAGGSATTRTSRSRRPTSRWRSRPRPASSAARARVSDRPDRPRRDGGHRRGGSRRRHRRRRRRDRRGRAGARAARDEIDARGLHVFPGGDRPARALQRARPHATGRAWRPARAALAAGGGTAFFDMPLNSTPPTVDARRVRRQARGRASALAHVDFALWGGLVPGNLEQLEELAERGVVGFKAFMSNSGIDDFRARRRPDALRGHGAPRAARPAGRRARRERRARRLARALRPRPAARLHGLAAGRRRARGDRAARSRSPRRPAARCTSCTSRPAAASRWSPRRAPRGVDVTCETCPHYLLADAGGRRGARRGREVRAAAPRRRASRTRCGSRLRGGAVRLRHLRPLARAGRAQGRARSARRGAASPAASRRSSCCSARRLRARPAAGARRATHRGRRRRALRLPRKGRIEPGADADLALVDLAAEYTLARRGPALPSPPLARTSAGACARASCARCCAAGPCRRRRPPPDPRARGSPSHERTTSAMLKITAGPFSFTGALERERAPKTVAAFEAHPAVPLEDHPRALERRVGVDPAWRPRHRPRPEARERHQLPRPRPGALVSGRDQRDRAAVPLRRHPLREHRRPTRRQPLPDHRRGRRPAAPAGRARALERRAGHHLRARDRLLRSRARAGRATPAGYLRSPTSATTRPGATYGRPRWCAVAVTRRAAGRPHHHPHLRRLPRRGRGARPLEGLVARALRTARRHRRVGADAHAVAVLRRRTRGSSSTSARAAARVRRRAAAAERAGGGRRARLPHPARARSSCASACG